MAERKNPQPSDAEPTLIIGWDERPVDYDRDSCVPRLEDLEQRWTQRAARRALRYSVKHSITAGWQERPNS